MDSIIALFKGMGIMHMGWGQAIMIAVSLLLLWLAIARKFEPLLLLPIGFGGLLSTFHSLEDRLTKQLFKEASTVEVPKGLPFIPEDLKPKMELVSRKPILPSREELENNNRAHSAKLRVAQKIHK